MNPRTPRRSLTAAALAAAALTFAPAAAPSAELADADSLSPATAVTVDLAPALSVSPAFSVGRLCLPGSTCP